MVEVAGFDMVYLIVSPKNPLKDSISSDSAQERYMAAHKAVRRHFGISVSDDAKVKVDDIELHMPEPHYTIRTLDALRAKEPEKTFTFVMGADSLNDIRRWKDYSRILSEFGVAVYPRTGYALETIRQDLLDENPAYKIQIINAPMVDISSSQIRQSISLGEDISHLLM